MCVTLKGVDCGVVKVMKSNTLSLIWFGHVIKMNEENCEHCMRGGLRGEAVQSLYDLYVSSRLKCNNLS